MPRELTTHKVNGCNESIRIEVLDEPGHGGACHKYHLSLLHGDGMASEVGTLHFQEGPIRECSVNGITHESLLAILIDRLEGFQSGPYACEANADALLHLESALECLQSRTRERVERGVEGTHEK